MPITVCFNDWTARTPERKVISTTRDCDRPLPYPSASWAHHSTFSRSSAEIPSTAQTPSSTKSTLKRAAAHVKSSSQTHAAGDHSRSASDQYSVPAAPNFTMQPVHMSAVRRCGGAVAWLRKNDFHHHSIGTLLMSASASTELECRYTTPPCRFPLSAARTDTTARVVGAAAGHLGTCCFFETPALFWARH